MLGKPKDFSLLDKFLDLLHRKKTKNLDYQIQHIHEEVFAKTNCLDCAKCCKTLGPLITEKDIQRISSHLRLSAIQFENTYLRTDEDGEKVFQKMPCVFLALDNFCLIYDVRPKACREYPHTDRKNFYQITNITKANIRTCPAAEEIVSRLYQNTAVK